MQRLETAPLASGRSVDPGELFDPIAFLRTEHEGQRRFCRQLDALVQDPFQPGRERKAASLLDYIATEIPLNFEAEEDLLAPLMRKRCGPEDRIDSTLAESRRGHVSALRLLERVAAGLESLCAGGGPERPLDFVFDALALADVVDRNVTLEDETLLPLAEARLTADDHVRLGRAMARRRGLTFPTRH